VGKEIIQDGACSTEPTFSTDNRSGGSDGSFGGFRRELCGEIEEGCGSQSTPNEVVVGGDAFSACGDYGRGNGAALL
jgi:hypothetical protein